MEIVKVLCPACGIEHLIQNPQEGGVILCKGEEVILTRETGNPSKQGRSNPAGFLDLLGAFVLGSVVGGAILYVPTVRTLTVEAVRKGAGVTREKVEEWVRRGE